MYMKQAKHILSAALLLALTFAPCIAFAQATVKDAYKAVVNIIAYDADGKLLRSGTGVYLDEQGTCAAPYSLLEGASSADVFDAKGTKSTVRRILGASSNYDVVRFSTTAPKKVTWFPLADDATFTVTTPVLVLRYTTNKKEQPVQASIDKVDTYDAYTYLHLSLANDEANFARPVISADARLVGFVQKNVAKDATTACAIDARFLSDLAITSTSTLNADLRNIHIAKALPTAEADARTYLYMLPTSDSAAYITACTDFIETFPASAEGRVIRARFLAEKKQYAEAEADFSAALSAASEEGSEYTPAEVHNELSKSIFQKALSAPQPAYADWTLGRAEREAAEAYALSPQPVYLLQKGRCLFANKKYAEAKNVFQTLAQLPDTTANGTWSAQTRAENWFYAARSHELAGGDSLEVIALLDSALAVSPQPYTQAAAQFFLERAQRLQRAGLFRRAVADYNEYEKIIGPSNLGAEFYYVREQAEVECRMYQQALDDIHTAVNRAPQSIDLKIEGALIYLRAGLWAEAVSASRQILTLAPSSADAYKIMGIALGEQGKKADAQTALKKAKELGDESAVAYLERYK